jgi:hypothetical protein
MIKKLQAVVCAMTTNSNLVITVGLAKRLQEEGQEYYLSMWPGVGHSIGSFIFASVLPETQTYLDSMTVYLRAMLICNKENCGGSK